MTYDATNAKVSSSFEEYAAKIAGSGCWCPCHNEGDICTSCATVKCEACRYLEGQGL